ncbi:MAG: PLP-dependent cysteine synthase family protein [Nocardioidaceae bacterium]|nr:PLP-dependent cysteine synthase family protein [Nocardioidaceae bacterium]
MSTVADSVLDLVGGTPLLRLDRLFPGPQRVLAKLEHLNPGGSHKVRIALGMVADAERRGWLTPGSGQTIVEPTGGNTGIGLAIACALRGYRSVLVVPDDYSERKQRLLGLYGAHVVLADHRRGLNAHGERAVELLFENPDWVLLNQQANPANSATHHGTTAAEIIEAVDGGVPDVLVCGVGTGGHLTGVGGRLRQVRPDLRIVAVVPPGCSLVANRFVPHRLQGLSVGLVPAILDVALIDAEVEVAVEEAHAMMRRCARLEGLAVGPSSAANLVATERLLADEPDDTSVLTFTYDSAGDYVGEDPTSTTEGNR